jgi:Tol biopolymer transport system component
MPLTPGQILNARYRIVSLLGQGGFGAVYRAWDLHLKAPCAVKENLDTTREAQQQFEREAIMLAKLHHTSLPRVIDHFSLPDQGQYLVMDFIEGDNLEEILLQNASPLPEDLVMDWLQQICSALNYLHAQQPPIIHRDIKPANIKITPQGKAYLVDFGIAKIFDPHLRTTVGARAVTPGYSPPEQYGFGKTDPRSDIYALGATLYKALTGQDPPESVQRTIGAPLPAPRLLNQALKPRTEAIILKAMDTTPTHRFQSAAELIAALQSPHQPITVRPASAARPGWPAWKVIAGIVGAMVLCGGMIAGAVVVYDLINGKETPQPTRVVRPSATDEYGAEIALLSTPTATTEPDLIYTQAAQTVEIRLTVAAVNNPSPTPTPIPSPTPTQPTATPTHNPAGGGLIAFHSERSGNRDIWVMNTDGSNPRQITYDSAWDSIPSWSPDGRRLAFQSDRDGDFEIYIYDLDTGTTRQVTFNSCADYGPTWASDGSRLVYYGNCNSNEEQREIFLIDIDGSDNQQLTDYGDHNNRFPVWSPDGNWITFTGYDNDGYFVYVMRTNGTDIRRLTRGCASSFSPDNTRLIYSSYCQGGEVNVMNVDGTNIIQLTDTPGYENSTPAWSPDGERITFQSDRDGDFEIYIMDADGSNVAQLTFNSFLDGAAVWQP